MRKHFILDNKNLNNPITSKSADRNIIHGTDIFLKILILILITVALLAMYAVIAFAAPTPTNMRVLMTSANSPNALTVSWNTGTLNFNGNVLSGNNYLIYIPSTSPNPPLRKVGTVLEYRDTGLVAGTTYVYKVYTTDASGVTPWSLKAAGITMTTGGGFAKPHAAFSDNSNMCQACHSVHTAWTPYKLLYARYTNDTTAYSTSQSQTWPLQTLPGVEMCFNCHDGSGASYNAKKYYDQPSTSTIKFPGHWTRRASTTASSFVGWRPMLGNPKDRRLPCMVCHDAHVSTKGNKSMLADGLFDYAKSTQGGWTDGSGIEQNNTDTSKIDSQTNTWEKCTVCHHGDSNTDGYMRVAGLDMWLPKVGPPAGGYNHTGKTACSPCHIDASDTSADKNVHSLGAAGRGSGGESGCDDCHGSDDNNYQEDVATRMMSNTYGTATASRHYISADSGNESYAANTCTGKCHTQHDNRSPYARNVWITTASKSSSTTAASTSEYIQAIGGLCFSCHSGGQTSTITTSNGTKTVQALSSQAYAVSSHNYFSTQYRVQADSSYFSGNCLKCHRGSEDQSGTVYMQWGPHASANRSLLYKKEENVCFDCHSSNKDVWDPNPNRPMATVAYKISQAFQQAYKHDVFTQAPGWEGRHRATESAREPGPGWMPSTARHVECYDCHNPHQATRSYNYASALPGIDQSPNVTASLEQPKNNLVVRSLRGVWGVYPSMSSLNALATSANYWEGYTSPNPSGLLYYTASASRQVEICLKCHSSYAYGAATSAGRPPAPSGVPGSVYGGTPENTLMKGSQSDILMEFNPKNVGYHPIFSPGKNQPADGDNTFWGTSSWRLASRYGAKGLSNTFVPPWDHRGLITCSDCHGHSSSSYSRGYYTSAPSAVDAWDFPRGPHGSARRWILKRLDRTIQYETQGKGWKLYESEGTSVNAYRNFCVNCHRADVYWAGDGVGSFAPAVGLSRTNHIPYPSNSSQSQGNYNIWGIACMNCHGGAAPGMIHGTGGTAGSGGSQLGKRLIYGATFIGWNFNATGNELQCYTTTAENRVTNCKKGHSATAAGQTASYSYTGAP